MSVTTKLLPLLNRILIRKAEPVTQTKTGVVIMSNKNNRVQRGTVVAVGPGSITQAGKHIPCCLKAGDEVVLPEYGGTRIKCEEGKEELYLYRENDILAKVDEE